MARADFFTTRTAHGRNFLPSSDNRPGNSSKKESPVRPKPICPPKLLKTFFFILAPVYLTKPRNPILNNPPPPTATV